MEATIHRKTTGQEYRCIGIDFEPDMEIVYLDPITGPPSTAAGVLDSNNSDLQEKSNSQWDQDELREVAIDWERRHSRDNISREERR